MTSRILWVLLAWLAVACGEPRRSATSHDASITRVADAQITASLDERLRTTPPTRPAPPPTTRPRTTGNCALEHAPRPDRDPNPMCLVEVDASTKANGLSSFYIDQFEVTVAQAALFASVFGNECAVGLMVPCFTLNQDAYRELDAFFADPGHERLPAWFSAEGARRYCAWVGKRLPTNDEWLYAALHDPVTNRARRFPWGPTMEAGRAFCPQDPACPASPVAQSSGKVPVGSFDGTGDTKDSPSPWGLYDVFGSPPEFASPCKECSPCAGQQDCALPSRGTWGDRDWLAARPMTSSAVRCARDAP